MVCDIQDCRVLVDGTEIPVTDVGLPDEPEQICATTWVRNNGAAAIKRYSEVTFPAEWGGEDIASTVNVPATVRIEARPPESTGTVSLVHEGYLKGVGSGGRGRSMRLAVGDWADFLDQLPASKTLNRPSVEDVVGYVTEEMNANINVGPTFSSAAVDTVVLAESSAIGSIAPDVLGEALAGDFEGALQQAIIGASGLDEILPAEVDASNATRAFKASEHTLSDVIEWAAELGDFEWWFGEDGTLHVSNGPPTKKYSHSGDGGGVRILEHAGVAAIVPINQVTVTGDSPLSIGGVELADPLDLGGISAREYPYAVARHNRLHDLAAGSTIGPEIKTGASTIAQAEQRAKRELRKRIEGDDGGHVTMTGRPSMTPYDTLTAPPTCNSKGDTEPITYGVKGVEHTFSANTGYQTRATVGIDVTPTSITIVESGTRTE